MLAWKTSVSMLSRRVCCYLSGPLTGADLQEGMLASASTISVVADALRRHKIAQAVIDPVSMHSSHSVTTHD